jgi:lysophospholipase L1-like esterase
MPIKIYLGGVELNTQYTIPTIETTMERFVNRRMIVTGDSITDFTVKATTNWHDYLKAWLDLRVVYNDGVSGSGITMTGDASEPGYYTRIDDTAPAGWDALYTALPDYILIMFSQNDGRVDTNTLPLGTAADITSGGMTINTSYFGNVRLLLEKLIAKYPAVPIGCISSLPRATSGIRNNIGYGITAWYHDWCLAEKTTCEHFSIPYLDLFHASQLRPWDATFAAAYMSDGIHPNAAGQQIIAYKIYEFCKQYL